MQAPCEPWCSEADMCGPCDAYDYDGLASLPAAIDVASSVLYKLSHARYPGHCTRTIRPCTGAPLSLDWRQMQLPTGAWWADPGMFGIGAALWGGCGCGTIDSCGCSSMPSIPLGSRTVVSVSGVKLDGVALAANSAQGGWRVDGRRRLTRLAGADGLNRGWPCCQRLDLPDTEVGTFSITYEYGMRPPADGVRAAAVLACQLALACEPSQQGKCQLPKRVTNVVRQGVSMAMVLDPMAFLTDGMTGLYEVDLFLAAEREDRKRGSSVLSPDISPYRNT